MRDFVALPHFGIVLALDNGEYVYVADNVIMTAIELPRGFWQLRFVVDDEATYSTVVEGRTLAEAEAALVKAMGRAEDVLTAALMQVSVECRHGEVRVA